MTDNTGRAHLTLENMVSLLGKEGGRCCHHQPLPKWKKIRSPRGQETRAGPIWHRHLGRSDKQLQQRQLHPVHLPGPESSSLTPFFFLTHPVFLPSCQFVCLKMTRVKHLKAPGIHHVAVSTWEAVLLGACHKPRDFYLHHGW